MFKQLCNMNSLVCGDCLHLKLTKKLMKFYIETMLLFSAESWTFDHHEHIYSLWDVVAEKKFDNALDGLAYK